MICYKSIGLIKIIISIINEKIFIGFIDSVDSFDELQFVGTRWKYWKGDRWRIRIGIGRGIGRGR